MVRTSPVCAETPLERQQGLITPNHLFYLRNNFPYPDSWPGLSIEGAVSRPASIGLAELALIPGKSLVVTMECAGNGRSLMSPAVAGEAWGLGAVSTADWSGVPLRGVLGPAGLPPDVREVVFFGSDGFARSLPVGVAMHPDTLLVTAMNGVPLPLEHGGPLRLLVPRWYGMASVKWLVRVVPVTEPFEGHFQTERYVIDGAPVREMMVRAVITEPAQGALVAGPSIRIAGYAWTGQGEITKVEISDDHGESWLEAQLVAAAPPYGWTRWQSAWRPRRTGMAVIVARATDSAGRIQQQAPGWNELGYCNNSSAPHRLTVAR